VALPGASGIDLLERLEPPVPAVVLTWLVSPAIRTRALEAGAHAVLTKPCRLPDFVTTALSAARSRGPARFAAV
jgi:CheY-like chemotaxis protein